MNLICTLLNLYIFVIIGRIVLEWVQVPSDHPVGTVRDVLATVVDPLLRPLRGLIPPLRFRVFALDLSPVILILGISVLRQVIC